MWQHTSLRYAVLILVVLAGIAAIVGSGGGSGGADGAPTLSEVTIEPSSAAAGLTITIGGTFTFTDSNGDLNGGSFNYSYNGTTYSFALPEELAGITSATVAFQVQVVLDSTTGTATFPCWLVDGSGLSSNTIDVSFTQLWTRQFGTEFEDIGNDLVLDSGGSVLVTGTTGGDLDGEVNPGGQAVFVTKYAADTSRAWTRVFGSVSTDTGRSVARDNADNVYVVGDTQGTSFDGVVADGSFNGFVTKFNADGVRQWTGLFGTAGDEHAYGVATDAANNVYVVGDTTGDLNGENNAGGWDAFLTKFDSDGAHLWTRLLGTTGSDTAYDVAVDDAGNVFVTGGTNGVLGVDPSPGDPLVNFDAFVAKYDPEGNQVWITQLGTSCTEWANSVAADAGGNLYLVGKIYQCAFDGNVANGGYDAFVTYLNDAGSPQWVRQFGTAADDNALGVTTDSLGNGYVTGYLDSVDFTGDNEGHTVFLARYGDTGTQVWLAQETAGVAWGNQGRAAASDSDGNIFFTGTVHGQLDGHVNPNPGEDVVFILKYDSGGTRR